MKNEIDNDNPCPTFKGRKEPSQNMPAIKDSEFETFYTLGIIL